MHKLAAPGVALLLLLAGCGLGGGGTDKPTAEPTGTLPR